jgi:hypothetical protein
MTWHALKFKKNVFPFFLSLPLLRWFLFVFHASFSAFVQFCLWQQQESRALNACALPSPPVSKKVRKHNKQQNTHTKKKLSLANFFFSPLSCRLRFAFVGCKLTLFLFLYGERQVVPASLATWPKTEARSSGFLVKAGVRLFFFQQFFC